MKERMRGQLPSLRRIGRLMVPGALAAVLAACGTAAAPPSSDAPPAAIRVASGPAAIMEPLLNDIATLLPGEQAGVAVGVIDGDQVSTGFAGNAAFDEQTLFEFGSITKVFTANILLQLADEGLLNLEDSVNRHLPPEYRAPKWDAVTLGQLSTHTGGVPRLPANMNLIAMMFTGQGDDPYASFDEAKLFEGARRTRLDPPGESWEYSNFGYALLGAIESRVTGLPYAELARQRLFEPLGMDGATLAGWSSDNIAPPLAADGSPGTNWTMNAFSSAGGIRGSLTDGLAFLRASMAACGEGDPVSRANCRAQQPAGVSLGNGSEMGAGWIRTPGPDGTAVWHNGGTGGYQSFVGFDPDRQRGIILLSNVSDFSELDRIGLDFLTAAE
jgi:CubicO group peptidase (beta-lactamase class C family)